MQTEKLRPGAQIIQDRFSASCMGALLRGVMDAVGSGTPPSARTLLSLLAFLSFVEGGRQEVGVVNRGIIVRGKSK